ncbi:MAG: site-specific integrase [Saccharofermentans sp.]|jgi:integrase|nr:site-specific integrase [Mageeibacillus sp.]MCI1264124.1 site-specific integrase [Saccharofermentans sp.]MCI1274813.1 site-specific integrase [Saccharofermentans sp.]
MPVYKAKNGTWYAMVRYTDWTGTKKQKCQRGFETKHEAQEWEAQFKLQKKADIDMTVESFYKLYAEDIKPRIKENTWLTKESIYQSKILPYLGKRKLSEISTKDIVDWQNTVMKLPGTNGKSLSPTYMKTIHAELSALFNHAIRYYDLRINPAHRAGTIGMEESKEMKFWTKEEYLKFAEVMMDRPILYYAFEVLYWTGIREGELFALTPEDFDFEKKTLRINKSYQRLRGKDVITTPKTSNSIRTIAIPDFLCEEIKDCLKLCYYDIKPTDRIFPLSKHVLCKAMERGSKEAGVQRIRVHDLRHSHVSLLINMGFTAFEIGKRVGHGGEKITYRYAHLFSNKQREMADFLDKERGFTKEIFEGGQNDVTQEQR